MARDGRFLLRSTRAHGSSDGEPRLVERLSSFDGANFFVETRGADTCHVYPSPSFGEHPIVGIVAAAANLLREWVDLPHGPMLLPQASHAVEVTEHEVALVEAYGDVVPGFPAGSTTLIVRSIDGLTLPDRMELRTDAGDLRERRRFFDYREVAEGVWRPRRWVVEYHDGSDPTPALTHELEIRSGQLLDADALELAPFRLEPLSGWWFIH